MSDFRNMIKIILPGEPVSRVSPTFSRYCTYDSQKNLIHAAKFQVLDQIGKNPIFPYHKNIPVDIDFTFFFPVPKSKENIFQWGLLPHIDTPDVDNILKFYCDVLKKIVFTDDRQIDKITAFKGYDINPRTEILIVTKPCTVSDQVKEVLSIISPKEISGISDYLSAIGDWTEHHENPFHLKDEFNIDYEEIAMLILEFSEKYADILKKLNKKFPGLSKVLKERMESK